MTYKYKIISIDFASKDLHAADEFEYIKEAIEWAAANLRARHKVILRYPRPTTLGTVVASLEIPEKIANDFNPGNHLRGISLYLLNEYPERYKKHIIGKRLLTYTEVPSYEPLENKKGEKL